MDFTKRNTDPEFMDDPNIDGRELRRVLKDVNRANRLLGGNYITLRAVSELIRENPKERYIILDMGCGDGSMLREVASFCKKKDIQARLIGMDLSAQAIAIGKDQSRDYPEIEFMQQDILKLKKKDLECDILLCTLTMHHFNCAQIPDFLDQFVKLAQLGVIINDLQRSRLAYYLFKGFSAIFIQTEIAKRDGLISIRSGFSKEELIEFSRGLPQMEHSIQWKWAFRYVWVMRYGRLS